MAVVCCVGLCANGQEEEAVIFEGSEHCEQMEFEVRDCCMQGTPARYRMESPSDSCCHHSCCHQGEQQRQDPSAMLRLADAPTLAEPQAQTQVLPGNCKPSVKYAPIQTRPLERSDTYLRCCVFLI